MRFSKSMLFSAAMISSLTVGCTSGSSSSSGGSDGSAKPAASGQSAATLTVSRGRTTAKVYTIGDQLIQCAEGTSESSFRIQDSTGELKVYFSVPSSKMPVTSYDLRQPSSAAYFDAAFEGKVLSWDTSLSKCNVTILANDGAQMNGTIDCDRTRSVISGVSETINIRGAFNCKIARNVAK